MPERSGAASAGHTLYRMLDRLEGRMREVARVRVLLMDGHDPRVRTAARDLLSWGFDVHLLGRPEGADADLAPLYINPDADPHPDRRQKELRDRLGAVARKAAREGPVPEPAPDAWRDPVTYGALLLALGEVDAAVGGSTRPTADVLRAALRIVGLRRGSGRLSAACFTSLPDGREYLLADVSVNPDPAPEVLVEIAADSAHTWQALTREAARVAFLSFSTHGSAEHERATRVRDAAKGFQARFPDVVSDGELQLDAAVAPDVARLKAPGSPLAGEANVLIFPSLESANITYKAIERFTGARAVGMILQGPSKPIHDLSRGASAEDIAAMALVAGCEVLADRRSGEGESS